MKCKVSTHIARLRARQPLLSGHRLSALNSIGFPGRRKERNRNRPFPGEPAEPRVRIHLAPPSSPSVFGLFRESLEIRACARDLRSCVDPENTLGGPNPQNPAKPIRARFG